VGVGPDDAQPISKAQWMAPWGQMSSQMAQKVHSSGAMISGPRLVMRRALVGQTLTQWPQRSQRVMSISGTGMRSTSLSFLFHNSRNSPKLLRQKSLWVHFI
jgi:hypothetical protein